MAWENPQLAVDISATMDLKLKALACHASCASGSSVASAC